MIVGEKDKSDKVKRLLDSVNAGVISPEEARTYILKSEDILEDEESFKKHNKSLNEVKVKESKEDEKEDEESDSKDNS